MTATHIAIGTCSICGGTVVVPNYGGGPAECVHCGAVSTQSRGPVIPMTKKSDWSEVVHSDGTSKLLEG